MQSKNIDIVNIKHFSSERFIYNESNTKSSNFGIICTLEYEPTPKWNVFYETDKAYLKGERTYG